MHKEFRLDRKNLIFEFIQQHQLAVLATISPQALPEAAVVGFAYKQLNSSFELYVPTFDSSRKCANLKRNPNVALVVGWEYGRTVQIEGRAEQIKDLKELKQASVKDLGLITTVAKYIKPERTVFFKIIPKWLKYSDLSAEPWERVELKFI